MAEFRCADKGRSVWSVFRNEIEACINESFYIKGFEIDSTANRAISRGTVGGHSC